MVRLLTALKSRLQGDRGEVGPIGYTIMVSGIVLLAIAVVAWGGEIADHFMTVDYGSGDGGGGGD